MTSIGYLYNSNKGWLQMERLGLGKKISLILCLIVLVGAVIYPSISRGQAMTHTVQRGDTLWSICEYYYGNAELWPKLWQMNPFITNPHLLKPGDIITLLEGEAQIKAPPPKEKVDTEPLEVSSSGFQGIDITGFTNVKAIGGLFVTGKIEPSGFIVPTNTNRLLSAEGDTVYIRIAPGKSVHVGDELSIAQAGPWLRHPVTGKKFAREITVDGRLVLRESLEKDFFRADILETYKTANLGDWVIPVIELESCIRPVPIQNGITAVIAAPRHEKKVIGQFSVVYLDRGTKDGFHAGGILDIVRMIKVDNPAYKAPQGPIYDYPDQSMILKIDEQPLGRMIIVGALDDTATAVVLESRKEIQLGSFVKSLSWDDTKKYVLDLPSCPLN